MATSQKASQMRSTQVKFEGAELGDPFNPLYSEALVLGIEGVEPDCGHVTCSTHCDPLIRQIRNRRDTGRDRAVGTRKGH